MRIVTDDEPVPAAPAAPALVTGYEPDRFQKFAIEAIERGDNVLVTAKTGSGKTFVGEYQIAKSLARGGRVFYTTPIKSLSNQKFHDLKQLFPTVTVGIMTGDIKFCPDADILVMTTEILRNLLFKRGTATAGVGSTALLSLDRLDAVVFDEVHYINDPDRGHVWEETLMLLPPEVKLVLLSATLSKPEGFARWLSSRGSRAAEGDMRTLASVKAHQVWLISTQWRAVPLEHCVIGSDGRAQVIMDSREVFHADVYRAWLAERSGAALAHDKFQQKVRDARRAGHSGNATAAKAQSADGYEGPVAGKTRPKSYEHQLNELLSSLDREGNLPAIFFVFSRAGCEKLAVKVSGDFLDSSDAAAVAHIWDFHLSRYRSALEHSPQAHCLRELACRGIAFHHSGLMSFLKEILEILFAKGLIKVLFATETFAVGINMPTKTVVFTAISKFTDGQMRPLTTAEYTQMAGRAGRRGKDTRGLVLHLPQKEPAGVQELQQVLKGQVATFCSRMSFGYEFALKLLLQGIPAGQLIEKSYWYQILREEMEQRRKDFERSHAEAQRIAGTLSESQRAECEERLAIAGRVATSQNARRKAAQRELTAWDDDHPAGVWKSILERHAQAKQLEEECRVRRCAYEEAEAGVKAAAGATKDIPSLQSRIRVLEECGYVASDGALTREGQLASEVHEGHPFLSVELFRDCCKRARCATLDLPTLLTALALFAGEGGRQGDERNKPVSALIVTPEVRELLEGLEDSAAKICRLEDAAGVVDSGNFWALSTEWVEPIAEWVGTESTSLPALAAVHGLFEGNVVKALLKLQALVEEFQAMAQLTAEVELLAVLEAAREFTLRDVIVAESLYLRI